MILDLATDPSFHRKCHSKLTPLDFFRNSRFGPYTTIKWLKLTQNCIKSAKNNIIVFQECLGIALYDKCI